MRCSAPPKSENCEKTLADHPLLHLPGGGIIPQRQEVTTISAAEMMQLASFHEIAQRHGIVLVCKACDNSFLGDNDGNGRLWAVKCKCRVLQADMGRPGRS
jgi:hypothetical protein